MDNDDEDEVLYTLDLLVSRPPGSSEVYLMQYPLRSHVAGAGSDRPIVGMQVRPAQRRVQMKLSMYPRAPDSSLADESGLCKKSFAEDKQDVTPKDGCQVLESSKESAARANYVAARFLPAKEVGQRGALMFVPIHSVTQMAPSFAYIDDKIAEAKKKKAETRATEAGSGSEDEVPEPRQIGVKYRKRETERAAERRKQSHAYLKMTQDAEPWRALEFNKKGTSKAKESLEALFVQENLDKACFPSILLEMNEFREQFRAQNRSLSTGVKTEDGPQGAEQYLPAAFPRTGPMSLRELHALPLSRSIPHMLQSTRLLPFKRITDMMSSGKDAERVVSTLRRCARLLRGGCWIPQGNASKPKRLEAAREIILSRFRISRVVTTREAFEALGDKANSFSTEFVRSVLGEVAVYKKKVGWEFKFHDDEDFGIQHQDIIEWQNGEWAKRLSQAYFQLGLTGPPQVEQEAMMH